MRRLRVLLLATVAGGCAGPTVEGTWEVTLADQPPVETSVTATFSKPDRMVAEVVAAPNLAGIYETKLHAEVRGDWKVEDGTLTVNADAVTVKGSDGEDVPEIVSEMATSTIKDALGRSSSGKVRWEGHDRFTVTLSDGKQAVFRRATPQTEAR